MLMIRLFLIFLFWGLSSLAQAQQLEPLQATVEKTWTVDSAREEAFRDLKEWVDTDQFPKIDPNLIENRIGINQGKGRVKDRIITVFDTGDYCIYNLTDDKLGDAKFLYYSKDGSLFAVELQTGSKYPKKGYKYTTINEPALSRKKGQLVIVTLRVSDIDGYIFKPNGTLDSHWVGNNCYEVDGSSCGTRQSFSD